MIRRPPRSTRTDTLFPYTTLFRSTDDAMYRSNLSSAVEVQANRMAADILMPWHKNIRSHAIRSEEHTSELQSLMRISYAVFCLKKKKKEQSRHTTSNTTN